MPNATPIGHRQEPAHIGFVSNVTSTVERYLHFGNNTSAPAPRPHINQPSAPDQSISSMDVVHGIRRHQSISVNQNAHVSPPLQLSTTSYGGRNNHDCAVHTRDKYKRKYNRLKRNLSKAGFTLHHRDKLTSSTILDDEVPSSDRARVTADIKQDSHEADPSSSKTSGEWDLPQIQAYIEKMENDERDLVTRACDSPIPDQAELLAKIQARNDKAPPPPTPCNPAAAAPAASGERPAYSAFRGSRPSTPDQNVRIDVPSSSSSGGSEPTYAVDHRAAAAPTVNRLSGWTLEAAQPRSLRPELRTGLYGDNGEHPFQTLLRKHQMPPPPPPPPSPTASNAIDELKNPATTTEYRYLAQEGLSRGLPQNAAVQWASNSIQEYLPSETGPPVSELSHKSQDDVDSMDEKTFAIHTLENRLSELQNRMDLCRDPERKKRMREIQDDLLSLMAEVIRSEAW
ncbi:hypothetical protein I316_01050 [Kwoniella heveanensis BCC8398]|uniref:Uncharacterized protein n=1 Tax=Kwoniella heveanensis BCC8398 TaxID=1296120 RepID=A0A1B9H1J5_9TREE|nr:hypothetical protein I316_01050 [Kwoniella heveanensis BCC8398]